MWNGGDSFTERKNARDSKTSLFLVDSMFVEEFFLWKIEIRLVWVTFLPERSNVASRNLSLFSFLQKIKKAECHSFLNNLTSFSSSKDQFPEVLKLWWMFCSPQSWSIFFASIAKINREKSLHCDKNTCWIFRLLAARKNNLVALHIAKKLMLFCCGSMPTSRFMIYHLQNSTNG